MLQLQLGPPGQHRSLVVFPLLAPEGPSLPYQLLPDALSCGAARIEEVGGGSVPELLAINTSDSDVLVMDGEQLIGARQNRTTSRSLILPAGSRVTIPVSCMEQGRWHHVSADFAPSAYTSPGKVRRHARRTEASHAEAGAPPAPHVLAWAQHEVWDEIAKTSDSLGTRSVSGALNEYSDQRRDDLAAWAAAFPWREGQVGVLALLGGASLALDVVGDSALYRRVHPRLMMGYAMDALSERDRPASADPARAAEFLDAARAARRTESPTVGGGRYQVLSGSVVGAELLADGAVVHLSAFPPPNGAGGPVPASGAPLRPPSRRRGPPE